MKPASARFFPLRKPGRSTFVCATETDFVIVAVIVAKAAERRRSRFVNIGRSLPLYGSCSSAVLTSGPRSPRDTVREGVRRHEVEIARRRLRAPGKGDYA